MGLSRLAALHGVATSHSPSPGDTVPVPDGTVVAVLAALGVDAAGPEAVRESLATAESAARSGLLPPTVVVWAGEPLPPALADLPPGTTLDIALEDVTAPEDVGEPPHPTLRVPADHPRPDALGHVGARTHTAPEPGTGVGAEPGAAREAGPAVGPGPGEGADPAREAAAGTPSTPLWWTEPPLGVHRLSVRAPGGRSASATLVVAPPRAPRPAARCHGFLVQLYSLLSARSWGMGDLGDLADLAAWSGRALGAGFVQVNPLHAAVLGDPTDPSPYRPSSRRFPDPVHLHVESVPEYGHVPDRSTLDDLRQSAAALGDTVLNKGALIDRDAVWELKRQALERVRDVPLTPGRRAAYCDFLAAQGQALEDHALWCALAEVHGHDWHTWPPALRDPRSEETAHARHTLRDRVDFHCRLAWLTDEQLAAAQRAALDAGMAVGIVHDLAVGVHPGGSDAWAQQDALARGMSVGAPPDAFNARGQDWGLPPWRPDALAASGYAPYRGLLRALFAHAGALRIDHVMGLFRLWWVPEGRPPTEGTYVGHDAEAMLAVLVLEAHRAGAVIVGEDLGTVEPWVRETLARRGVLGTSVLWFERDWDGTGRPLAPEQWRESCLATATTHDLPSTAARLDGDHVLLRDRLGLLTRPLAEALAADAHDTAEWLGLLARLGLLPEGEGDEEGAVRAVHRFLLRTPARMVGVWLPDALGDRRPQNVPGTWDQYPNWRLPVADAEGNPVTLEELAAAPRLHRLMEVFERR